MHCHRQTHNLLLATLGMTTRVHLGPADRHIVLSFNPQPLSCSIISEQSSTPLLSTIDAYAITNHTEKQFAKRGLIHFWQYTNVAQTDVKLLCVSLNLRRRLTRFLSDKPKTNEMKVDFGDVTDCFSLVRYLTGTPKLLTKIGNLAQAKSGDILLMVGKKMGHHCVIFLAPEIVLHKLGSIGDVFITDLPSAKRAYGIEEDDEWHLYRPFDSDYCQPSNKIDAVLNVRNSDCNILRMTC